MQKFLEIHLVPAIITPLCPENALSNNPVFVTFTFTITFSLTEKKRKRQKHHYPSVLKHSIVALPSRNSATPRACENRDYKNNAPLGKDDLGLEHRPAACCLPLLEIKLCMHAS